MNWNSAAQTHLDQRLPCAWRYLFWTTVTPIAGGAAQSLGFWTGDDHDTLTVNGQPRLYYGAQGAIDFPPFVSEIGTQIRAYEFRLGLSPEGEALVRGYRLGGAPIEIHTALFDARSMLLIDVQPQFIGEIANVTLPSPDLDQPAAITLSCVSSARRGTMTRGAYQSDASQRLRSASDTIRAASELGSASSDPWGSRV